MRRTIDDTPHGSPEASTVKVFRIVAGQKVLVLEEDPWDSDLQPGTTLNDIATGTDPVGYYQKGA